jgi:hypothetical protein
LSSGATFIRRDRPNSPNAVTRLSCAREPDGRESRLSGKVPTTILLAVRQRPGKSVAGKPVLESFVMEETQRGKSISEHLDGDFFDRGFRLLQNLRADSVDECYDAVKEDMTYFAGYTNGTSEELFFRNFLGCAFLRRSTKYEDFEKCMRAAFSYLEPIDVTRSERGMFFLILSLWIKDAQAQGRLIKVGPPIEVTFNPSEVSAEMRYFFITADRRAKQYIDLE